MLYRLIILLLTIISFSSYGVEVLEKTSSGDYKILHETVEFKELIFDYTRSIGANLNIVSRIKKGKIKIVGNRIIKKDKMDDFLSKMASFNRLALIISKDRKEYSVVNIRDSRYLAMPLYNDGEEIPNGSNFIRATYRPKSINIGNLTRNLRPFRSRYGRITENSDSNVIMISDSASNVKEIFSILKLIDTPVVAADIEDMKKINENFKKMSTEKEDFITVLNQNNVMFIVIFSLIFLIIGFLTRGYVIRHIEGGL